MNSKTISFVLGTVQTDRGSWCQCNNTESPCPFGSFASLGSQYYG